MHILAIPGSLRRASFNHGLLHAARDVAPAGATVEIVEAGDLPLFNEDLEAAGWPAPVAWLRDQVAAADGVLFACPEYNYNVSGVLKNAFDWLSRPEAAVGAHAVPGRDKLFVDKPCALFGASAGMGGTIRAQLAFRQSLQLNAALAMPQPEMFVAGARAKFDAAGDLTDADTRAFLARFMRAFADWIGRFGPAGAVRRPAMPVESGGPAKTA